MRARTETTVDVTSEGTPETSTIKIGRPSAGRRNIFWRNLPIVSLTSMPENMKEKRGSERSSSSLFLMRW